jgi:hypothetical protein
MALPAADIYEVRGGILTCTKDAGNCDLSNGLWDPINVRLAHIED